MSANTPVSSHSAPPRRADPRQQLVEVVQQLSLARDMATIVEVVRHAARSLSGADGATFVLRDGEFCHYVDEDAIAPLWKGQRFPLTACVSGWAMANRQAVAIEDIYTDSRVPVDAYRPTFVKSLLMVPIRTQLPLGAIGTYWATRHRPDPAEIDILQALANTTAVAIENVNVYAEADRRVRTRTEELEAANKELQSFSYSASHDLKAPLISIDASIQLLRIVSESQDATVSEALQNMERQIAGMHGLIDALLRLSTLTRTPLSRSVVDLTALAREIAATLRAPGREARFVVHERLHALGDEGLLRIALTNLLGNAWKYSVRSQPAVIEVGSEGTADARRFFVRDNGVGFDPKDASRLFTPFTRLHADEEFKGNGVGLATVQRIIERHGGSISADAIPGEGATFYFSIPEAAPAA